VQRVAFWLLLGCVIRAVEGLASGPSAWEHGLDDRVLSA